MSDVQTSIGGKRGEKIGRKEENKSRKKEGQYYMGKERGKTG